jgi:hypothetical protein
VGYPTDEQGRFLTCTPSDSEEEGYELNKFGAGNDGGRGKRAKRTPHNLTDGMVAVGKEYDRMTKPRPNVLTTQWNTTIKEVKKASATTAEMYLVVHEGLEDGSDGLGEWLTAEGIRIKSARLQREKDARNKTSLEVKKKQEGTINSGDFTSSYTSEELSAVSRSYLNRVIYNFKRAIQTKLATQGQDGVFYKNRLSFDVDGEIEVMFHAFESILDLRSFTIDNLVNAGQTGLVLLCPIRDIDPILNPICPAWKSIRNEKGWVAKVKVDDADLRKKSHCRIKFKSYASKTCQHERNCPGCMNYLSAADAMNGVVHEHKYVREGDFFWATATFYFTFEVHDNTVTGRITSGRN